MSVAYGNFTITDVTDGKGLYTLVTNYSYTQSNITTYSTEGYVGTWDVTNIGDAKVGDTVFLRVTNSSKNGYCYIIAEISEIVSSTRIKCTSIGLLDKGEMGDPLTIKSKSIQYVASSSGTTTPTSGWQNTIPTVSNGQYLWTKITTTYSDDTEVVSYSVSYMGTNGTNGYAYMLEVSTLGFVIGTDGELTNKGLTVTAYQRNGNANRTAYSGRFLIEQSSNGTSWTQIYKSSANESTKTITLTMNTVQSGATNTYKLNSDVILVRTTLYASGGTTNVLDRQTSAVLKDGVEGNGISQIKEFYMVSNSDNPDDIDINDTRWTEAIQTPNSDNRFLWNKEEIYYTNGNVKKTSPVLIGTYSDMVEEIENIYYCTDKVYDNLIPFENNVYEVENGKKMSGVTITYDETGVCKLSGTSTSSGGFAFTLATMTLEKNKTYVLYGNYNYDCYIRFRVGSTNYMNRDGNGYLYTPTTDTMCNVSIQICVSGTGYGKELPDNAYCKPILLEHMGDKYDYSKVEYQNRNNTNKIPLFPKLPTVEVTETSDEVYEEWSKSIAKYNTDYKYYFFALQVKSSSGVKWSNFIYDPSIYISLNQTAQEEEMNNRINGVKTITDIVNEYLDDIKEIHELRYGNEEQGIVDGIQSRIDNSYAQVVEEMKTSMVEYYEAMLGKSDIEKHMKFDPTTGLVISGTYVSDSDASAEAPFQTIISDSSMQFVEDRNIVAYINGKQLYVGTGVFERGMVIGGYYERPVLIANDPDYGGVFVTWEG